MPFTAPGPTRPLGPPAGSGVPWAAVHATTRWGPTVTTFGWPVKAALTVPFPLWFAAQVLASSQAGPMNALVLLAFGGPLLAASLWWAKQVWAPGRATPAALTDPARQPRTAGG